MSANSQNSNCMEVRPATKQDIEWIVSELEAFSNFYGSDTPVFGGVPHVTALVETLISSHLMLVCDDSGTNTGLIGGFLGPHLFNPKITVLTELFWWVPEQHRGSKAGRMLLDAFQDFGKKHATWTTMTLEADSPVPESTLTKRGFVLKERNFYMETK